MYVHMNTRGGVSVVLYEHTWWCECSVTPDSATVEVTVSVSFPSPASSSSSEDSCGGHRREGTRSRRTGKALCTISDSCVHPLQPGLLQHNPDY